VAKLGNQIREQRREVANLKRDEQRLSKLIDGLAKLAMQRSLKPAPNKKDGKTAASPTATGPIARVEETPDATSSSSEFTQLRGRLRLPVRGELMNRFGTPRAEGGTTWRGLFIRAASGSEVKAVAGGRVVFADWLRGFGNLIILDHGGGYMTVYGYNDSLLRRAGQNVTAGENIAAAGSSGGNPESGLYFELRSQGQPVDPLKWVSIK
jgi:septal ring factor EnvC (AmiA/AmiB activator)